MSKRNGIVGQAVALVEARSYYHGTEVGGIIDAGRQIDAAGGPDGPGEARVVEVARNLERVGRSSPKPAPEPTPLDERVQEAAELFEKADAELKAALDLVWDVRDRITADRKAGKGRNVAPDRVSYDPHPLEGEARTLTFAADEAERRRTYASARLNALKIARDRWRAVQVYERTSRK